MAREGAPKVASPMAKLSLAPTFSRIFLIFKESLKTPRKRAESLARLEEVPASTVSGNVSFETSVAAQSRIEVPVIVNVFKP